MIRARLLRNQAITSPREPLRGQDKLRHPQLVEPWLRMFLIRSQWLFISLLIGSVAISTPEYTLFWGREGMATFGLVTTIMGIAAVIFYTSPAATVWVWLASGFLVSRFIAGFGFLMEAPNFPRELIVSMLLYVTFWWFVNASYIHWRLEMKRLGLYAFSLNGRLNGEAQAQDPDQDQKEEPDGREGVQ